MAWATALVLLAALSGNEAATKFRRVAGQVEKRTPPSIKAIAAKLPPGFGIDTCDEDGNGSVTWKELYDALAKLKIAGLTTGDVQGVVTKFAVDGPKAGAGGGLDQAEFAKMVAYFKKVSADSLIPKDLSEFDRGCYDEEDGGEGYRGLVTRTTSGRQCQNWLATKPHNTGGMTPNDSNGLGNHNFCRNPDGSEKRPWCFTMDPTIEKETCNVPVCQGYTRDFQDEADTVAKNVAEGLDCDCAEQLYGASTTTRDTTVKLLQGVLQKCRCPVKAARHAHRAH